MLNMIENKIYFHHKFTDFMNDYHEKTNENLPLYSLDTSGKLHLTLIPGVLKLSSKSFKTTDKTGYIMKEFNSAFNILPPFMVKTNKIKDYVDKYVVVKINQSLDSFTGKFSLIGTIDRYIGNVGDRTAEKTLCQIMSTCHWNRKIDKMITPITSITSCMSIKNKKNQTNIKELNKQDLNLLLKKLGITDHDLTPNRCDMSNRKHIYTVSVDPIGSQDIDDAISIEPSDSHSIEIGIHIADPSSYLIEDSDLDKEIANRIESVYLKDVTYHMFPTELATNLFSLKQGVAKRAFSVMIQMKLIDGVWRDTNHYITKTIIKIDNNTSYDRFQSVVDGAQNMLNENADNMRLLYDIGQDLYTYYLNRNKTVQNKENKTTTYSSQKMIEIFMVLANYKVAEEMVKLSKETGMFTPVIIRSQQESIYSLQHMNLDNALDTVDNSLLIDHIKLRTTSAELRYYNSESNNSNRHSSLDLDLYTQFTSPIRRYSDILVHRIMYNLMDKNSFTLNCLNDSTITSNIESTITPNIDSNLISNKIGIHEMFLMNHYKKFYKHVSQLEKEIYFVRQVIDILGYYPSDRIIYLHGVVLDVSITDQKGSKTLSNQIITLRVKCLSINVDIMDNLDIQLHEHDFEYLKGCIHTIKITSDIDKNLSVNDNWLFQKIDYKMCFLDRDVQKIRTYM